MFSKIVYNACSRCNKSINTTIEKLTTEKGKESRVNEALFKNRFRKVEITYFTKDFDYSGDIDSYLLCENCWLDFVNKWLEQKE